MKRYGRIGRGEGYGWLFRWMTDPVIQIPAVEDVIFRWDMFDGDTDPQVGSYGSSRITTLYTPTGDGQLTEKTSGSVGIGAKWIDETEATLTGVYMGGLAKNWLTYSEDFTNAAWTAIGTGSTSSDTATGPTGSIDADTISGSASGDGIQQDSGVSVGTSKTYVFSVYLKTSTSTATVKLVIYDDGDTSEGTFVDAHVTTKWRRFEVPYLFENGTGTVACKIIVDDQTNVRAWGAQLDDFSDGTYGRTRQMTAGTYVPTTASVAATDFNKIAISSSTFAPAATRGSIAFWYYGEIMPSTYPSSYATFFSMNGDDFSCYAAYNGPQLRISGTNVLQGSVVGSALYASAQNQWQHIAITWDTSINDYHCYINGTLAYSGSTASGALPTGDDLYLGAWGGSSTSLRAQTSLDGIMSQVIIWDSVITAGDVTQLYNIKQGEATRAAPGTGKIFSVDLGSSLIPTTGDTKYVYHHKYGGLAVYPDTTTTLATADREEAPICQPFGGTARNAMRIFGGRVTNEVLFSEQPDSWADVSTPTVTDSVGTFGLGEIEYGTIDGIANEGIWLPITIAPYATNGNKFCFSVYASVSSGTLDFDISLFATSGTADKVTVNCTATTTEQRFHVYHPAFTNASTGFVAAEITLAATGVLRVGGMMVNEVDSDLTLVNPDTCHFTSPPPYIKTTNTTSLYSLNAPIYRAKDSINWRKGTLIAWAFMDVDMPADFIVNAGPTIAGAYGQGKDFYARIGTGESPQSAWVRMEYGNDDGNIVTKSTMTPNTYYHYAFTWDYDEEETSTHLDGALIETTSGTFDAIPLHKWLWVGNDAGGAGGHIQLNQDHWPGGIATFDIYGEAQDTATILADFNATKSSFGK